MNRESIPVFGDEIAAPPPARPRALDRLCAWLSWGLPLLVAIEAASGEASFRDDLGIVRDLGFARVGLEGVPSTLLTQLLALLPLGGRSLRASLLGVLALAFASRLFFGALRDALDRRGPAAIHPLLALFASSIWALGPALQTEAARLGGSMPAVALVLLGTRLALDAFEHVEPRALAATGLVLGTTLAESHAAGACLALVLASLAVTEPHRHRAVGVGRVFIGETRSRGRVDPDVQGVPTAEQAGTESGHEVLVAAAAAFVLLSSLRWFQPASAPALPPLDMAAGTGELATHALPGLAARLREVVVQASDELGAVVLAVAAAGLAVSLCFSVLRRALAAWALPLALCALVPAALGPTLSTPLFDILSSLGLAAFFPVALQALVRASWAAPFPLGRPGAVLAMTFAATPVLSRADAAWSGRPPPGGGAAWAEEALGKLPADSVLLVQSPTLAYRLLASRTLHGTREDVILVPAGLLSGSSLAGDLQRSAPSASPLLRQLWVNGVADEYSLSRLADERPVLVELDPSWDSRLLEHLRPEGLWLRFSAAASGGSERRAAAARSRAAVLRVLDIPGAEADADTRVGRAVDGSVSRAADDETRRALGDALARQAMSLAALAERESARRLLTAARRIDRGNPLAVELGARLAGSASGRVAISNLLVYP